jgi:galactose mutarotase-like enzyme
MGYTTLENSRLRLTVDSLGAQMMSLQTLDGREYLWQGDPRYWCDRAPVLFPFVGRLTGNSYRYGGQVYSMGIHGFAAHQDFSCLCPEPNRLVLQLTDNGETREQYPFAFSLNIIYELIDNRVQVTYQVENSGTGMLPFGIGGHPGFRVPLEEGEQFDDYILEFTGGCQPDRVGFTPQVFLSGQDQPYPLKEGKYLPLRHDLFDEDAVILKNMSREVTLRSQVSPHGVQVSYPDMPYLGLWHMPNTDAPYLCIEPWSSLPARQDVVEDFACKSDLIQLGPGKTYVNTWSITIF